MAMPHENDYLDRCIFCRLVLNEGEEIAINVLDEFGDDVWYDDVVRTRPQSDKRFQRYDRRNRFFRFQSEELLLALHKNCRRLISPISVQGLLKVLTPSFEPLPIHEKHRLKWACESLAGRLTSWASKAGEKGRELAGHTNVMLMIAEYLLPEYLTLDAEKSLQPEEIAGPFSIASEPVWGSFNDFQGVRYVRSLSNQKDPLHDAAIYNPRDGQIADVVYMAQDCLGVVKVIFAHSSEPIEVDEIPGVWWRTFAINHQDPRLYAKFDGVKLRWIGHGRINGPWDPWEVGEQCGCLDGETAWPVPHQPVCKPLRSEMSSKISDSLPEAMSSFVCNGQNVVGYSACVSGLGRFLVSIHAHETWQDTSMYDAEPDDDSTWLFMPMDDGEVVTEIWEGMARDGYLWSVRMKTNKNRIFRTEDAPRRPYGSITWEMVDMPKNEPSRVFFQCWRLYGINHLAFESPKPNGEGDVESIRAGEPLIPKPVKSMGEHVFFTSAVLKDVIKITLCRHADKPGISGLLLTYADGHQESLGEVRLNGLRESVEIDERDTMWLGFKHDDVRTVHACPYVAEMAFEPLAMPSKDVLVIPLTERLDWWSSCYQDYLVSGDQASPQPVFTSPRD
ncbi:hypothetical protein CDV31_014054 [Fusarium ambrosium]|uniref:Uncharacterized protein n=1 Tax=Fusarium ambrosium TaxID=131363 RepID=A0A428SZA0_9HYPO|nr:hypothetical protein CDV31_014054 [Fusarium ambrosium]